MNTTTPRTDAQDAIAHNWSDDAMKGHYRMLARALEHDLAQAWKVEEVASRGLWLTLADLGKARAELATERARLDWLDKTGQTLMCWNIEGSGSEPDNGWTVGDIVEGTEFSGKSVRAAIDAAMKAAAP